MDVVDGRYTRGKIYTIQNRFDGSKIYVGSTIETLGQRYSKHKHDCRYYTHRVSLYKHINNNDWNDWVMSLFEDYPCRNKRELEKREYEIIGNFGDNVLNRQKVFHG